MINPILSPTVVDLARVNARMSLLIVLLLLSVDVLFPKFIEDVLVFVEIVAPVLTQKGGSFLLTLHLFHD